MTEKKGELEEVAQALKERILKASGNRVVPYGQFKHKKLTQVDLDLFLSDERRRFFFNRKHGLFYKKSFCLSLKKNLHLSPPSPQLRGTDPEKKAKKQDLEEKDSCKNPEVCVLTQVQYPIAFTEEGEVIRISDDFPKGTKLFCRNGHLMHAKRGSIKAWHFSHTPTGEIPSCQMTEWHWRWQEMVKPQMIEVSAKKEGRRRRADVLTSEGLAIEIQHSAITGKEIAGRQEFYGKNIWIFDCREMSHDIVFMWREFFVLRLSRPRSRGRTLDPYEIRETKPPFFLDFGGTQLFEVIKVEDEHFKAIAINIGAFVSRFIPEEDRNPKWDLKRTHHVPLEGVPFSHTEYDLWKGFILCKTRQNPDFLEKFKAISFKDSEDYMDEFVGPISSPCAKCKTLFGTTSHDLFLKCQKCDEEERFLRRLVNNLGPSKNFEPRREVKEPEETPEEKKERWEREAERERQRQLEEERMRPIREAKEAEDRRLKKIAEKKDREEAEAQARRLEERGKMYREASEKGSETVTRYLKEEEFREELEKIQKASTTKLPDWRDWIDRSRGRYPPDLWEKLDEALELRMNPVPGLSEGEKKPKRKVVIKKD